MDKRSKKIYDKAMHYYEKGKINKALEICESELSESLKNSAILNLKGLLLYQKGDLNGAVTVWKINKDFNNDPIAKNYIKDAEADKKRLELYNLGESQLKQLKIDSAIELFKKCTESDFNSIKVNTALALCYEKKGNFKSAKEHVMKVLSIDENSIAAKEIKKDLEEIGVYDEEKKTSKKVAMIAGGLFFIILICLVSYPGIGKFKESIMHKNKDQLTQMENIEQKNTDKSDTEVQKEVQEIKDTAKVVENEDAKNDTYFSKEELTTLINNADVDKIYEDLKNIKEDDVKDEDKEIYNKAIGLLKDKGVEKFYEYGLWYFNQANYDNAEVEFNKAYKYCSDSYLKEDIIYYKASTLSKKGDIASALTGYEEYYNQYPKGSYIEGILYELSLLNNDKEKSKKYANILMNQYPKSIYINEYILNVINN